MATQTPTERQAREVLAEDLWTWAERQRKDDRSWRWIADRLAVLSQGRIQVTKQYLNQLYLARQAEKTDAEPKAKQDAGQPAA